RENVNNFISHVLTNNSLTIQYRIVHSSGEIKWIKERAQVIYDEAGNKIRINGTIYNITQQKLTEEQLTYKAFHDTLTNLPNRAFFNKAVNSALKRMREDFQYQFAVLFINLDGFKIVNDHLGRDIGDRLLIAIAKRLQNCVKNRDLVARVGGDEFTILLSEIQNQHEVVEITERILNELSSPFSVENHTLQSGASIGIVMGCSVYTNHANLLRDADSAMYQAKNTRKGHYVVFNRRAG
ncbi:MAG: sensor domain-containing diguanylate cyclase, partial [Cyanobacteria bacterium P01_G01_bin.49]